MRFNLSQGDVRQFTTAYQSRFSPPRTRQVFNISGKLGVNGRALIEVFDEVRGHVLTWMKQKGVLVPEGAWQGESFELDAHQGHPPVSAISIEQPHRSWAAQLVDDDQQVPGRKWITEVTISLFKGEPWFAIRQNRVSRLEDPPVVPAVPRFVRSICESPGLYDDGYGFELQPWVLESEDNLHALLALLQNPARTRPVLLISLPNGSTDPQDALIQPRTIAKQCLGLVHVVVLTPMLSWRWSNIVGRGLSAFDGAVLTYQPGFSLHDEPFKHPKVLPTRIKNWDKGPKGFEVFLINKIYQATAQQLSSRLSLPTFAEVKRVALDEKQKIEEERGFEGLEELVAIEKQKIAQLEDERDDWRSMATDLDEELRLSQDQLAESQQEVASLRARIQYLEHRFQLGKSPLPTEAELPNSLNQLEEWASNVLSGRVHIKSKALRAARDSEFHDPRLIYKALLLLANEYWLMRTERTEQARSNYLDGLLKLGLSEDASLSNGRAGEEGDTYYTMWQDKRCYLERHLKKGTSHEPRYCLRIYFFWDEETETVVVGWLPSHLRNRMT
jgi:hypothetical protein